MARPEECRNPYQLFFPHHHPSAGGLDSDSRLLQHQSVGSREWYSTNLQATTVSATVQVEEYASGSQNHMAVFPAQAPWARTLLLDCARAIAEKDSARFQSILWILNESASPYGDCDQRLVSYFVQALLCKISGTGARCIRSLSVAAEKTYCFETMRSMILEFQVIDPLLISYTLQMTNRVALLTLMSYVSGHSNVKIIASENTKRISSVVTYLELLSLGF